MVSPKMKSVYAEPPVSTGTPESRFRQEFRRKSLMSSHDGCNNDSKYSSDLDVTEQSYYDGKRTSSWNSPSLWCVSKQFYDNVTYQRP